MTKNKSKKTNNKKPTFAPIGLDWQVFLESISLGSRIGFSVSVPVAIFIFGGAWLDKRAGSSPLFIVLGLVLGLIVTVLVFKKIISERLKHGQ